MRKYIQNEELHFTLQEILSRCNPEILEVYKDVILYRMAHKQGTKAEEMLQYPVKVTLSFINMALLPILDTFFAFSMYNILPEWIGIGIVFSLLFFTIYEACRFSSLAKNFYLCKPYLLVDELFERHILVIHTSTQKPAKAAK